jgi:hypothetical protein
VFEKLRNQTEKIFIKKSGEFKSINSTSELSNIIMEGVALPAIGINIDNRVYPLSFRNMANVIIEHYASKKWISIVLMPFQISYLSVLKA